MSVELKVGQVWKCRNGNEVTLLANDGVSVEKDTVTYPFMDSRKAFSFTNEGFYVSACSKSAFDLIELVQDENSKIVEQAPKADEPACQEPPAIRLLQVAADHMRDRAAIYDKPDGERSMGKTVEAFNAVTGRDLSESEGWLLLQILKDVRLFQRPRYHADSAEDCVAYAALKAEAKMAEGSNERRGDGSIPAWIAR